MEPRSALKGSPKGAKWPFQEGKLVPCLHAGYGIRLPHPLTNSNHRGRIVWEPRPCYRLSAARKLRRAKYLGRPSQPFTTEEEVDPRWGR